MSGTSMAAALVSGTLALVLEVLSEGAEPGLTEGSEDLGEPGYDPSYGFGRLSVLGTLVAALSGELPVLPSSGETELFLYRLSPLRVIRIKITVTDSPKNSLEVLLYPSIFDSRTSEVYFCYYLSLPGSGDFDLRLELVYPDEGRFVKTDLWTYSGFLSSIAPKEPMPL